ncbi:UNVERIFIED_CONTAM: hypothetical protein Slati_2996900 [Sesamum latifolium]|uniref:Reverse transcriptase/retrotransposon-derived protein RNase H-like domain-containing protein n=1 Tax=Sesamum latifolium TaxID=2727402 RepID=A0AAW2VIP5_9LAMI
MDRRMQPSLPIAKSYLIRPPLLSKLEKGERLWIYLVLSPVATGAVLMKEKEITHLPVYFISRLLQGAEIRYDPMRIGIGFGIYSSGVTILFPRLATYGPHRSTLKIHVAKGNG